jgi:hypothetical protein
MPEQTKIGSSIPMKVIMPSAHEKDFTAKATFQNAASNEADQIISYNEEQ